MSDAHRGGDPLEVIKTLPKGSFMIFRHYQEKNRAALAKKVLSKCRQRKILCLIGADIQLALKLNADGVHLPEAHLKKIGHRPKVHKNMIITAATHSFKMVRRAYSLKINAAILSPVYKTKSHPGAPTIGRLQFAKICKHSKIPIIALGGIGPNQILNLMYAGAFGIAGIELFANLKLYNRQL